LATAFEIDAELVIREDRISVEVVSESAVIEDMDTSVESSGSVEGNQQQCSTWSPVPEIVTPWKLLPEITLPVEAVLPPIVLLVASPKISAKHQ
jgi:hypothetical protein